MVQFWSRVGFSVRQSESRTGGPCHYPTDFGFFRQNFTVNPLLVFCSSPFFSMFVIDDDDFVDL
ncbi:hypothetical protein Hanom_Chr08g00715491 [Helianthus anomalus]